MPCLFGRAKGSDVPADVGRNRSEAGAKQQEMDLEKAAEGKRIVSWEEISKHDKPKDCWVVYEGLVYDVTDFVPNHPGGAALWWQGGGRDITILFNISHPPRVTFETHLAKYGKFIGEADGPEVPGAPEYDFKSPFWVELKEKCWAKLYDLVKDVKGFDGVKYYKATYGETDVLAFCMLVSLLNIATFIAVYISPVFWQDTGKDMRFWQDWIFWKGLCIALFIRGPLVCVTASLMHEARHRASFALFYIVSDMSGMSSLRYQLEHSWHHNWPNCPAGEVEQSFAYAPGMRHFLWQPRRCYHRFQMFYWPLSFCLVLLQVMVTDVTDFAFKGTMGALKRSSWTFNELFIFVWGKFLVVFAFFWPYISHLAGWSEFSVDDYIGYLIIYFGLWFSSSFWLTFINVPAHLTMDELEDAEVQDIDFAKTQIAHSRTFSAGSRFLTWVTFGTNTQTEHHLFPTAPFRYMPDITPVIQEVSEKHNVNFRSPYDSFLTVFKLYLDRIVYLSKSTSVVDKAPSKPAAVVDEATSSTTASSGEAQSDSSTSA
jgi:cytochrome b involved in lipid metabolism/fatty acid desaturase